MYRRTSSGDKEMKITRRQLRALIKEECKRALTEATKPKRNVAKCVAAAERNWDASLLIVRGKSTKKPAQRTMS